MGVGVGVGVGQHRSSRGSAEGSLAQDWHAVAAGSAEPQGGPGSAEQGRNQA